MQTPLLRLKYVAKICFLRQIVNKFLIAVKLQDKITPNFRFSVNCRYSRPAIGFPKKLTTSISRAAAKLFRATVTTYSQAKTCQELSCALFSAD
jgi:hypothetical protein